MKKSILLVFASVAFFSCSKQPIAGFTTDKTEYTAGETIKCTNTSVDGSSYIWEYASGQLEAQDLDLEIPEDYGNGTVTITLTASNKQDNKSDSESKTINISAAMGNGVFWQRTGSGFGITVVSVDGISSNITSDYSSIPNCGAQGCAVFNNLTVGSHNFTASDGITSWNGVIEIQKDKCTALELN